MSSAPNDAPNQVAKLGLRNLGKTQVDEVMDIGGNWMNGLTNVAQDMRKQHNVNGYQIMGSKPHMSTTDPSDTREVMTIGFFVEQVQYFSVHLHEDGSYNIWQSRKVKRNKKQGGRTSNQPVGDDNATKDDQS
ncbi:hypothetical protein O1611_g2005 [Lasiodiplodia mahajangana]|uniref:Uncharacterized protein n=1 Tax=Lasiodiplodia mahajangana TaxID=1108764 RepID=A0ACC2JWH8_9PEZI|nr:hypothetical protein O1611_g2005 [Lasiodiplodia mahajangana]